MKEMFQHCLALVFAICVASPACCCDFTHETGNTVASSCCGGGEQAPDRECDCGCVEMTVTTDWKAMEAISCNQLEIPSFAPYEMISLKTLPDFTEVDSGYVWWIDTVPPARRRAWLQCFLI